MKRIKNFFCNLTFWEYVSYALIAGAVVACAYAGALFIVELQETSAKNKEKTGTVLCVAGVQVIQYEYLGKPVWYDSGNYLSFKNTGGVNIETNLPCAVFDQ